MVKRIRKLVCVLASQFFVYRKLRVLPVVPKSGNDRKNHSFLWLYMYQTKDTDINKKERFVMSKNYIDNNSLAHIACKCKYHIKIQQKNIYGKLRVDIGKILRRLCERKGVKIIETEMCMYICFKEFEELFAQTEKIKDKLFKQELVIQIANVR